MQDLDHDEATVYIDAPPEAVYAIVADVTRTPEYSPEVRRCRWVAGATGPAVGARFEAVNRASRGPSWRNRPVVTVADPGREFAFSRTERAAGTLVWRYQFRPEGGGTRVTESYTVERPVSALGWFAIRWLYGGRDRRTALRTGMVESLDRLRRIAESDRALHSG